MTNFPIFFRKITTKLLYLKREIFFRYLISWLSEAIFFFFFCAILFGRWKKFMVEYNFAVGNLNVEFSFCCSTIYNKHLIKITKSWFRQDSRKFDFAEGRFWKILREFNIMDFSKNYNIREIFFPRKFTPLKFDHSPISKGTITKKKKEK